MTPTLFPQMAQSTFQPLLDRLEVGQREHEFTSEEVRELLLACGLGASVLEKLWELFEESLRRGLESRKLRAPPATVHRHHRTGFERSLSEGSLSAAGEALAGEERSARLRTLDEQSARARAMRDELASLQRWLQRPPPPVDLAAILGSTVSSGQKGYEDLDDILARLKAGGDV